LLYSIDTSGLINPWRFDYPPTVFPGIWDSLSELIDKEVVVASEEVFHEIKPGDDLYDWVNARKKMFLPLDADVQQAVTDILSIHTAWIPPDRSKNMADPFVVAVAKVHGCTVVSGETWSNSPKPENVRIPNVCHGLGIRHITFLELMREQGWMFTR
jgi:hypothetical protein